MKKNINNFADHNVRGTKMMNNLMPVVKLCHYIYWKSIKDKINSYISELQQPFGLCYLFHNNVHEIHSTSVKGD